MSRTRDRNVAIAIITVVAIGFAAIIAVSVLDDPGRTVADEPPPLDVPAAVVHESFDDACDAFADGGAPGNRAKAPAEADKDELASEYVTGDSSGPAVGIGLTVCGRGWIIVVGVRSPSSVVPAVGPRGTPVIAYVQPPYTAL